MTHTPGPWSISKIHVDGLYGNNGEAFVIAEDRRVCAVDCEATFKRGQGYLAQCDERDANARLIAAAPELLEAVSMGAIALDEAANTLDGCGLMGTAQIMREQASRNRAAIARAGAA